MDTTSLLRGTLDQTWEALRPQLEASLAGQWRNQRNQNAIFTMAQAARWLDRAENREQWRLALVEAAAKFSDRSALFLIESGRMLCVAVHGIPENSLATTFIPLHEAPAFQSVVDTGETVTALRRAAELSPAVSKAFKAPDIKKAHLLPLQSKGKVLAVLYAEGLTVDLPALELLVSIAAGSSLGNSGGLVPTAETYNREDQTLHAKAKHFARVKTAALLLDRPLDVRAGRRRRALYSALHGEIDSLRTEFASHFFSRSSNMVDYLHLELIRTLANDDATLLGTEYPGPML